MESKTRARVSTFPGAGENRLLLTFIYVWRKTNNYLNI
jgi:hypothetical protein